MSIYCSVQLICITTPHVKWRRRPFRETPAAGGGGEWTDCRWNLSFIYYSSALVWYDTVDGHHTAKKKSPEWSRTSAWVQFIDRHRCYKIIVSRGGRDQFKLRVLQVNCISFIKLTNWLVQWFGTDMQRELLLNCVAVKGLFDCLSH